uniref:Galectin n=1 Tax=Pygocentrus nattereri TaxID=42514 RepID=A0A3B4CVV9_PYGNA
MALYFQGVVNPDANNVVINLKLGPKDGDDIAFHFNARINNSVVRDSCRNGKWEGPEETQWCPIVRGSAFDIFIVVKAYVNGQKNCFFKHRMPVEKVTTLNIKGEVIMNTIGYVGMSSVAPLTGGLKTGMVQILLFCVACSFTINLKAGQREGDDIAFHFNPRVGTGSVVRNSFRNGQWQNQEVTSGGPFVKGGAFDLFIVVKPEGYEVIVNGYVFCMFLHRMPVESVSALNIRDDVFMTNFGLIEVSSFFFMYFLATVLDRSTFIILSIKNSVYVSILKVFFLSTRWTMLI